MDQLDSVCPISCDKEGERLYQVGSGVLIEFRNHSFLLTAGHVIDEAENADLLVPHENNEIRSIEGTYAYFKPPGSRETDFLDYGYFKLDKDFIPGLKESFYFVKERELGIEKDYKENELFSVAGYPYRKSNVAGMRAKTDYYAYGTYQASLKDYEHFGVPVNANIITKFDRKNSYNPNSGRVELPVLPHGISGGGVFIWPKHITKIPPDNRKLVGICHTWKNEGYFIATRVEFFLEAILRNNPNLRNQT